MHIYLKKSKILIVPFASAIKTETIVGSWLGGQATWDKHGRPEKIVGIHVDITDEKNSIEIKHQRDVLAQLVEEKTKALRLANEELEHKNIELIQANRAKSDFLATMSHEIRTPMNGVIGFTSLLIDTNLDYEQRDYVETIRASGDALLAIINDVLDFSKIESGIIELENHTFRIHQCIEGALDTITLKAYKKQIELASVIDLSVPGSVFGDARRLRQILVNLLGNAVKFTEKGEIVVHASCSQPPVQPGTPFELHIKVQDTGVGIPKDKFEKIFDSFSQADASTARRFGGTGLGLSICKGLCQLMDGDIWVESEEHIGSTFHFTIKLETPENWPDSQKERIEFLNDRKLLITTISNANKQLLQNQCSLKQIEAHFVHSNRELLTLFETQKGCFDAIVLDPDYSDIEEHELKDILKKWSTYIPVVLLCNLGAKSSPFSSLTSSVLHKPIKRYALFTILEDAIRNKPNHALLIKAKPSSSLLQHSSAARILVAEDNIINQKLIGKFLEILGYEGDIVSNGDEVLKHLRKYQYDAVLMDVNMPVMDGLETTSIVRETEGFPNDIHIIGITAGLEIKERRRCIDAGMNDFLGKPMTLNELKETLNRALNKT